MKTEPGDKYLQAASAARVPMAIHFLDGEIMNGRIIAVGQYTLVVEHGSNEQTIVSKGALKKITAQ